ncbi:MAG: GTP 3',8-cyclase MoaA, partial [Butyricicoccus sp.]
MLDNQGRNIRYLRLSVTDRCNFRCRYCMPAEGVCKREHSEMLSFEELTEIVRTAVSLGVSKVRLTGGEPLVRRGIVDLCRSLRAINGVRELTMTTNGALLPQYAAELKQAGVDRLNISLDTLNKDKFASLTRGGSLADTLAGLDAAWNAGFRGTKLNAVLLGGVNADEIPALAQLAQDGKYEVRFIELMPIGECADWPRERFLSADAVLHALPELQRLPNEGVAERYRMPVWKGKIGLIRPMSHRFCADCDRIRVTADGRLK